MDLITIKYADDTIFYELLSTKSQEQSSAVTNAIKQNELWSEQNGTVFNINLSNRITLMKDLFIHSLTFYLLLLEAKFLGVIADCKRTFSNHVN